MNTETTAIKIGEHRLRAGRMLTLRACVHLIKRMFHPKKMYLLLHLQVFKIRKYLKAKGKMDAKAYRTNRQPKCLF